ncbi:hypothetical protein BSNK01_04890 [Bacillaceae bacterium]
MERMKRWTDALGALEREGKELLSLLSRLSPGQLPERPATGGFAASLAQARETAQRLEQALTSMQMLLPRSVDAAGDSEATRWNLVETTPADERSYPRAPDVYAELDKHFTSILEQISLLRGTFSTRYEDVDAEPLPRIREKIEELGNRAELLYNGLFGAITTDWLPLEENLEYDDRGEKVTVNDAGTAVRPNEG